MFNRNYTPKEVARACSVSDETVQQWIEKDGLPSVKNTSGHRRIPHAELVAFLNQIGHVVPAVLQQRWKRLVVVDDDEVIERGLQKLLKRIDKNLEFETVSDGMKALPIIRDLRPDLVILDLGLPGLDGYDVCEQIKDDPQLVNTKVLVLTGDQSKEARRRVFELGADDFIGKPFQIEVLAYRIADMIGLSKRKTMARVAFGRERRLFDAK